MKTDYNSLLEKVMNQKEVINKQNNTIKRLNKTIAKQLSNIASVKRYNKNLLSLEYENKYLTKSLNNLNGKYSKLVRRIKK